MANSILAARPVVPPPRTPLTTSNRVVPVMPDDASTGVGCVPGPEPDAQATMERSSAIDTRTKSFQCMTTTRANRSAHDWRAARTLPSVLRLLVFYAPPCECGTVTSTVADELLPESSVHSTVIVYIRPVPGPARSERSSSV